MEIASLRTFILNIEQASRAGVMVNTQLKSIV